ncbi:MAG: hypothetical protein KGI98_09620 [Euryarchaeota archaeon]|nr:hypothetical protein [Euryarchaeota archaeon]
MHPVPSPTSTPALDERFLGKLEGQLASLDRRIKLADIAVWTGRSRRGTGELRELRARSLLAPRILDWIAEARSRASTPMVERRLELLRRHVVDCQLEHSRRLIGQRSALQRAFSEFAPKHMGGQPDSASFARTLKEDPDRRKRKRAYYGLMGRDRVLEPRTLALIRERVEHCREIGQGSLASARLALEGLTIGQWHDLSERLVPIVRARMLGARSRFQDLTQESGWYPWDYRHLYHLELDGTSALFPPERAFPEAVRAAKGWGFPPKAFRFSTTGGRIPFGGLSIAVEVPSDVRIIMNPRAGWSGHSLMCHEVGHAVSALLTRQASFLLRSWDFPPSFGGLQEGIGMLFPRSMSAPGWLRSIRNLTREQAQQLRVRAEEGFWWEIAMTLSHTETEVQAYLHPDRDPGVTMNRLERELYGYDSFEPRMWADAIQVESPLYFKSYVLGAIVSTQVLRAGLELVGGDLWPNPKLGPWLAQNWFAPGAAYDWMPRVAELTGHPLGVRDLTWNWT